MTIIIGVLFAIGVAIADATDNKPYLWLGIYALLILSIGFEHIKDINSELKLLNHNLEISIIKLK